MCESLLQSKVDIYIGACQVKLITCAPEVVFNIATLVPRRVPVAILFLGKPAETWAADVGA
jgi:hypothetical protein